MTKLDHILSTTAIGIISHEPVLGILASVVGARIPDLDLAFGIPHRTWTHWWPFYAFPAFFLYDLRDLHIKLWFDIPIGLFLFYMCIGGLLHLAEDVITTMGIPLMIPNPKSAKLPEPVPVPKGKFGKPPEKAPVQQGVGLFRAILTGKRWTLGWTKTGGGLETIIVYTLVFGSMIYLFTFLSNGGTFSFE